MKYIILLAFSICLFTATDAQKTKTTPVQKTEKTFIVTAATAKDLPEGVVFANNKLTLKKGFKFENLPNNAGVNVVNAKGSISGSFTCQCQLAGSMVACSLKTGSGYITCDGNVCCSLSTTIQSPKIADLQMKQ